MKREKFSKGKIIIYQSLLFLSIELVELHTKRPTELLNLLLKEKTFFDNVHKDIKGLIKTRKDLLSQAIEKENEMDEEERLVYHELFVEESKSLIIARCECFAQTAKGET